jgi:hypothetical protein
MPIDNKYGRVTLEHGNIGEDEPVFVFRAKDKLLPQVLAEYIVLCVQAGAPREHLELIFEGSMQIMEWQKTGNPRLPTSYSYYARVEDPESVAPRPDPTDDIVLHLEDVLDILADRAAAARRKGREADDAGNEHKAAAHRGKAIGLQQGADQINKVLSTIRGKEDNL